MRQIVECIPNFSEGRRQPVIDAIVAAVREAGATLLDVQADAEQNRSVVRFAGTPTEVERAALAAAAVAVERIDMREHSGAHPRVGAVDVMPFVPIAGIDLDACVEMAQRVGSRLAREHGLPVYLYGAASPRSAGRELGPLREGQYEGLAERIGNDPERAPDFGPRRLGPAGAALVGARHPKVVALADLSGATEESAEQLARCLDGASGGLTHLEARAIGVVGEGLGLALTLSRIDLCPLHRVCQLLEAEAGALGIGFTGLRLVGPLPQRLLDDAASWHLKLRGWRAEQVIETRVAAEGGGETGLRSPRAFVESVAAASATPGGGTVAALAGALGAALAGMVARLTAGRPKYADLDASMQAIGVEAEALRDQLLGLMDEDASAFETVMQAYRLPRERSDDAEARREAIQAALRGATAVPLEVMRGACQVLSLAEQVAAEGNASAVSDAGVAGLMAQAAARAAALNIEINVMGLRDLEEGDRFRAESAALLLRADQLAGTIDRSVRARINRNP